MLVLSRKLGESIKLGDDVEITVCLLAGNRVRLGIVAPSDTKILRGELVATKNQEGQHDGQS